jgi:hypothetical protein
MQRILVIAFVLMGFVNIYAQSQDMYSQAISYQFINKFISVPKPGMPISILYYNSSIGITADIEQDTLTTTIPQDFSIGITTGLNIISSPSSFDSNDLLYGSAALAATGLTFLLDDEIRSSFNRNHSKTLDNLGEIGHRYGDLYYMGGISAGVYVGGKIFGSEPVSVTGRMLLEGLFYAGATTIILKTVLGRSRPYMNEGNTNLKWFQTTNDYNSMPSGHCTVAFAFSSVLAERLDNVYASIFLYGLASTTIIQRMYSDNHWASDCLAGSVIGYIIGKAVVKFDDRQKDNNINLSAVYLPNGAGINLQYIF